MKLGIGSKITGMAITLAGCFAGAHPLLSDTTKSVPAGSSILTYKSINVPPDINAVNIRAGDRVAEYTTGYTCTIYLKAKSSHDRELIPRNMPITSIDAKVGYNGYYTVTVKDPAVSSVYCAVPNGDDSIGDLLKGLEGIAGFKVYMPGPEQVNFEKAEESPFEAKQNDI